MRRIQRVLRRRYNEINNEHWDTIGGTSDNCSCAWVPVTAHSRHLLRPPCEISGRPAAVLTVGNDCCHSQMAESIRYNTIMTPFLFHRHIKVRVHGWWSTGQHTRPLHASNVAQSSKDQRLSDHVFAKATLTNVNEFNCKWNWLFAWPFVVVNPTNWMK